MSKGIDILFEDLKSTDNDVRFNALTTLQKMAEETVPWFYDRYDELINKLENENSFHRSIGIMLLCDLAKSDTKQNIVKDLEKILKHIKDEKFITSRQCIQNIWKIAVCEKPTKAKIEKALIEYYKVADAELHGNLLRQDIIRSLWEIRKAYSDEKIDKAIMMLISIETDIKNKKKLEKIIK